MPNKDIYFLELSKAERLGLQKILEIMYDDQDGLDGPHYTKLLKICRSLIEILKGIKY